MSNIKGLIFDLDGVLVNTKKLHFEALNLGLKKVKAKEISYVDHLNIYDGLPTIKKLEILKKLLIRNSITLLKRLNKKIH